MKWIKKLEKADQEEEFATDENKAIIEFDGNQDVPYAGKAFPIIFIMDSAVIGQVRVEVFEDGGAIVDGVTYSTKEIKDFLSRGLGGDELKMIHRVKKNSKGFLSQERTCHERIE